MNYTDKNKLIDSICGVGLMLLLIEILLAIFNSAYTAFNYNINNVTACIYIVGGILLAISIFLLIRAYKKDDGATAFYGIEMLLFSIVSAILPATYLTFTYPFNMLNKVFPFAFLGYYIVKFIVIIVKAKKKVSKQKGKKK